MNIISASKIGQALSDNPRYTILKSEMERRKGRDHDRYFRK